MRTTVTCTAVAESAQVLKAGAEYIADVLDNLSQELTKLGTEWLGDASSAYAGAQTEWLAAMTRLAAKLNMCAAAADSAQQAYQKFEQQVTESLS